MTAVVHRGDGTKYKRVKYNLIICIIIQYYNIYIYICPSTDDDDNEIIIIMVILY